MSDKLRIYMNNNVKMSRGKYAAQAVHAALLAVGAHPNTAVVVLGTKPKDLEAMRIQVRDAGRTEVEPGTLTAATDWASDNKIYTHRFRPGPEYWDWRCLTCSESCKKHVSAWKRFLWRRLNK